MTTKEASKLFAIAEIRIWELIRNGRIEKTWDCNSTHVDKIEVSDYFAKNPEQLEKWQDDFIR